MRFLSASTLSQANLEQERRSIQGLVSDISHQVKTPIANLRLYEDILEERLDGDDRELVRHLIRETELLEFLIHSLVKISRLESGTIQLSPEIQPLLPFPSLRMRRNGWNQNVLKKTSLLTAPAER